MKFELRFKYNKFFFLIKFKQKMICKDTTTQETQKTKVLTNGLGYQIASWKQCLDYSWAKSFNDLAQVDKKILLDQCDEDPTQD